MQASGSTQPPSLAPKYELERSDNASIGLAVSAFVSDAALEWT